MSAASYDTKVWFTDQVTLDATGDKPMFFPGLPVEIVRVGFLATVVTTGTGLVLKFDSQLFTVADGTPATRGDGDVATVTPAAVATVTKGFYNELTTPFQLDAGEGVIPQVTTAYATGDGVIFIEYRLRPFVGDSKAPVGSFSNRISQMTKVTA